LNRREDGGPPELEDALEFQNALNKFYASAEASKVQPRSVKPLGIFASAPDSMFSPEAFERKRSVLASSRGAIPEERRAPVVEYLRRSQTIKPIMGVVPDMLEGRFFGGMAIQSDGIYFWREDTADYVERYGVELPAEFLSHGEARGWVPVRLSVEEWVSVDLYLSNLRKPRPV
jgi:hypothetical protein